jgi:K+-sensing histidine kinase KdpD
MPDGLPVRVMPMFQGVIAMFAVEQLTRVPPTFRYVVAIAAVLACTLIRWTLDQWLGPQAPFTVFFFGIMFSAFMGGLGPGLFATVLSLLASHYFFTEPRYILFALDRPHEPLTFAMYALVGVFVSILCHILRSSEEGAPGVRVERCPRGQWKSSL